MKDTTRILIIGTYGIDIFYGILDEMEKQMCAVIKAISADSAQHHLGEQRFDIILINLEPDGRGGISGVDLLSDIAGSSLQENAVCLGVSAQNPSSLLASAPEKIKHLSILAGWLTLPILPKKATDIVLDIIKSPGRLTVKNRQCS